MLCVTADAGEYGLCQCEGIIEGMSQGNTLPASGTLKLNYENAYNNKRRDRTRTRWM